MCLNKISKGKHPGKSPFFCIRFAMKDRKYRPKKESGPGKGLFEPQQSKRLHK